jgi:hypothetical protein
VVAVLKLRIWISDLIKDVNPYRWWCSSLEKQQSAGKLFFPSACRRCLSHSSSPNVAVPSAFIMHSAFPLLACVRVCVCTTNWLSGECLSMREKETRREQRMNESLHGEILRNMYCTYRPLDKGEGMSGLSSILFSLFMFVITRCMSKQARRIVTYCELM